MDELPAQTIGVVAARSGVAASSIRYYERIGLLPEPDRLHGHRRYCSDVLGRLAFIGVAQSAGFTLAEIGKLTDGAESSQPMAEQMRSLSRRKLQEVDALVERAQAMKVWLEVAKECGCESAAECALFPDTNEQARGGAYPLQLIHVDRGDCRRRRSA